MKKKQIIFLTEGSASMGLGHITRCLALSEAFLERGCRSSFIVHGDKSIRSMMGNQQYKELNWLKDIELIKPSLSEAILIVDTFAISDFLLSELSSISKVSILDDFIRRNHSSRIVIDWTINAEKKFFLDKNLSSNYLLGNDYIALRRQFWDCQKFIVKPKIDNILIMFGSSDIRSLCVPTANLLAKHFPSLKKTIIIGSGSKDIRSIESMTDSMTKVVVDANANEVIAEMANADLAIASGGQTLYELACVGVPTISIMLIDNQLDDINGWNEVDFTCYAGNWDDQHLESNILSLYSDLSSARLRQSKSTNGQTLVDGQGARRIARYILNESYDC